MARIERPESKPGTSSAGQEEAADEDPVAAGLGLAVRALAERMASAPAAELPRLSEQLVVLSRELDKARAARSKVTNLDEERRRRRAGG